MKITEGQLLSYRGRDVRVLSVDSDPSCNVWVRYIDFPDQDEMVPRHDLYPLKHDRELGITTRSVGGGQHVIVIWTGEDPEPTYRVHEPEPDRGSPAWELYEDFRGCGDFVGEFDSLEAAEMGALEHNRKRVS